MKTFLRTGIAILPFIFSTGHATLPDFVWGLAPFSYQNLNRIQVQLTDELSLYGYRGDVYNYQPARLVGETKWAGWDFSSGFSYQILKESPIDISAGAAYKMILRSPAYFESSPGLHLDLGIPIGPVKLEMENNFEIRYLQAPPLYPDVGPNKATFYRWEPLFKISPVDRFTKLQIMPYLFWQGHIQNKRSQPTYAYFRSDLINYKVPFYNEIEAGFQARLTPDLEVGIGERFYFLSTRSLTGFHRLTTYLTWHVDLSQKSGN